MNKNAIFKLIVSVALPVAVGSLSGYITSDQVDSEWFTGFQKPAFNPPNYIFAPVWTTLYVLMGISMYLIWQTPFSKQRQKALIIYFIQLILNFWWSIFFFSLQDIFMALIDIILLLMLIVYMIVLFRKIKPVAAYINIPYALWVAFATLLTISFSVLNNQLCTLISR